MIRDLIMHLSYPKIVSVKSFVLWLIMYESAMKSFDTCKYPIYNYDSFFSISHSFINISFYGLYFDIIGPFELQLLRRNEKR